MMRGDAVVDHADHELRDVDHDVESAEVARHPAPALQIGGDRGDLVLAADAVHRKERSRADDAVDGQAGSSLERFDRRHQRGVVELRFGADLERDPESETQRRHARIVPAGTQQLPFGNDHPHIVLILGQKVGERSL